MRKLLLFCIASSPFVVANVAQAIPTAYYDRPTGNIYLQNDLPHPIPIVNFHSPSGRFTGTPNHIPGIADDFYDAPNFLVYFNVPPNGAGFPPDLNALHNLGAVVADRGPLGDLSFRYWVSATLPNDPGYPGLFVEIPEPSALVMAGVALGIPCLVQRAAG